MKLHPVNKEQIKQETKVFFRSQRWKNLLVFLVFVGIASIFWLMQYFQQTGDYDATVSTRNPHSETTLSPDSLSGTGREIPIRISGTLSPAAGYRFVDSLRIEPGKTWVSGDKNILDTLQWIYTQTVNVEKIQKNVHINVKLQVPKGLTASIQKVRISADLEEYVEKKFELPVTCINLPDNIYVRFFPSTVEIVCYLSLTDYTSVKTEDLEVGVDYSELLQNTNVNIPPTMLRKPQWMDDYRIIPETLEYLIEQKQHL